MLQKQRKQPLRSQSLNLQKKKQTLQLPRFFSKPKNGLASKTENSERQPLIKDHVCKPHIKPSRVGRYRDQLEEYYNSKKNTNLSVKKSTSKDSEQSHKPHSLKRTHLSEQKSLGIIKYSNRNNTRAKLVSQNIIPRDSIAQIQPKKVSPERQFRTKSIKTSNVSSFGYQKAESNNKIRYKIPTETDNGFKVGSSKMMVTEAQSPYKEVEKIEDQDRQMWLKVGQLLRHMAKSTFDLRSAEEYITSERIKSQKRICMNFIHPKHRNRVRMHLALTRICIYLYVHLILHQTDIKTVLALLERLHQSYRTITVIVFKSQNIDSSATIDKLTTTVSRNNQYIHKTLHVILSKRRLPHHQIFHNMLQSATKIQDFQFLEVIDKTLKWQIIQMPSYPYLPPSQKQHHLVLDLDQTLIHFDQATQTFHVRPYAEQFIIKAAKLFEITVFTAATKEYADQIINEIDPKNSISHRLYRNHLTFVEETAVKDLSMLGRSISRTLIVDNLSANFRLQPQNGIHIHSWYGGDNDQILEKLYRLLVKILEKNKEDLRVGLKQHSEYIKEEIALASLIYQLKCEL